jgi:hypothetical protein
VAEGLLSRKEMEGGSACGVQRGGGRREERRSEGRGGGSVPATQLLRTCTAPCPDRSGRNKRQDRIRRCVGGGAESIGAELEAGVGRAGRGFGNGAEAGTG